jgi:hypothetical protein
VALGFLDGVHEVTDLSEAYQRPCSFPRKDSHRWDVFPAPGFIEGTCQKRVLTVEGEPFR